MTRPIQTLDDRPDLQRLTLPIIEAASSFAARAWMLGTSGSLSVRTGRNPLQMLITISGKDKGSLTPLDFLQLTDDGHVFQTVGDPKASSEALFQGEKRPSGETLVHEAIYRTFPDAGAVYHVHSTSGTLCSQLVPPGSALSFGNLEMLKGIGRWEPGARVHIPVVHNHPDIPKLAEAVAKAARAKVPGVLVQGHGTYIWGQDPARARRHVEIFEFLFDYDIKRRSIGFPG